MNTVVIIFCLFFFLLISYEKQLSPPIIFNSVWLLCFLLYFFNLSEVYSNTVSDKVLLVYLGMIFSFNIFFMFGKKWKVDDTKLLNSTRINALDKDKYISHIFNVWLFLIILEILYFRGFPLLWILIGRHDVSYASFGFPSLHGFINSLSWFTLTLSFQRFLDTNNRKLLKIILVITGMYVLLLARQSMMTEILQLAIIYVFKRKIKLRRLIGIMFLAVIVFGLVGNIRTSSEMFVERSKFIFEIPDYLLGIVWASMYIISSLGNMNYFIEHFDNFQYGIESLRYIMPTAILNLLHIESNYDLSDYLILLTFNISSGLKAPYSDFGIYGVIICFAFLGYLGGRFWYLLQMKPNDEKAMCNYAVYAGIITLTFFFNGLLSLPIVMQFVYINLLFRNYFR